MQDVVMPFASARGVCQGIGEVFSATIQRYAETQV